jgi:ABC-type transport system substrate-binding protein
VRTALCLACLLAASAHAAYQSPMHFGYVGATERIRGFDPVTSSDTTAIAAISKIYQGLYEMEYLARPYGIRPMLAEAMPEVSPDRLRYTIRIKKGVYFTDDPCFAGGKGRELTAEDFVYSWKRLADAHNRSTRYFSFEGRIVGLDEYHEKSTKQRMSYDEPVEGLKALDRFTLQIRLKDPYPQLSFVLTQAESFAVPREAVEFYGEEFLNHPVGTGPFVLHDWKWRNYRIEFARNPHYHADFYPTRGEPGDREKGLLEDAGKALPLLDTVTQYVIQEDSTAWLMFLNGELGLSAVSRDNFDVVLTPTRGLTPEMKARGIWLSKDPEMYDTYIGFNMNDPVLGPNKKLRQALACAVDHDKWVKFFNDRHLPAKGPIPPNVPGYDPDSPPAYPFDLERARRLIAEAGYPDGLDPKTRKRLLLTIELPNASDPQQRQSADLLASFFEQIGVDLRLSFNNWPEFLKKLERRQAQMWQIGWIIPYPDAINFLLLFYSKNASPGPNDTNYNNPAYDKLYEQARVMEDSPERTALYQRMAAMVVEDAPWIFMTHPLAFELVQPWLKNYKHHDCPYPNAKYYRVDPTLMKH